MNKKDLREIISAKKKELSESYLKETSEDIMNNLEENVVFKCSKTVMLYYSLPDEVYTHDFIEKWYKEKTIILPVVEGNDINLKVYKGKDSMKKGAYNIYEPEGEEFTDIASIDMVIVPGVAFDDKGNRLGRGKGYYDRLLEKMKIVFKVGVCFEFQLVIKVPTDTNDIPMDEVWTEKGFLNKK